MIKKISFICIAILMLVPVGFNQNHQKDSSNNAVINQKYISSSDDVLIRTFFTTRADFVEPVVLSASVEVENENSVIFSWDVFDPLNVVSNIFLKDEDLVLFTTNTISGDTLINDLKPHKYNNWHLEVYYDDESGSPQMIDYPIEPFSLVQNKLWMYVMIGVIGFIIFVIILMYILYRRREKRLLKTILAQEQAEWDQHNYY